MSRFIDGVTSARRPTAPAAFGRVPPRVEPERQSFETRTTGRGSKVNARRVNALPKAAGAAGRTESSKKPWKERLQMPLIIVGGMLAGFAVQNTLLGQVLIIAFGAVSLIYRIPSRISFVLALAALLTTTFFLIFIGNVVQGQTFATYTFLFLVVGVITLNRELKKEGGRVYSRRPRI